MNKRGTTKIERVRRERELFTRGERPPDETRVCPQPPVQGTMTSVDRSIRLCVSGESEVGCTNKCVSRAYGGVVGERRCVRRVTNSLRDNQGKKNTIGVV